MFKFGFVKMALLVTVFSVATFANENEESASLSHPSLRTFLCEAQVSGDAFTRDDGLRSMQIRAENAIEAVKLAQVSLVFRDAVNEFAIKPLTCVLDAR